jgi:predicted glycosyltransferase
MFVVTHLLGTGHLARVINLGRAFRDTGHDVAIITGGLPAPQLDTAGLDIRQVLPLRSDGTNFGLLLDANDRPVDAAHLARRRAAILKHFADVRPDVLCTELFPFGRRSLREEFRALLAAAEAVTPRPLICTSIRDILHPPSKPSRAETARSLVDTCYDAVLVHSDPQIVPLETSWPVTPEIARKLHYTGFVAQPDSGLHPQALGTGEIIVSTGGGNTGQEIFDVSLEAARLDAPRPWRLLVGGSDIPGRSAELARRAPANAIVEPTRPDFRQMLHHAEVSVSMCGYNTTLDLLQAGVPAVCVPLDGGNEVEQSLRAEALARLDGFQVIATRDLTPERLLAAIAHLRLTPKRALLSEGQNGATRTVEIVETLSRQHLHAR